MNHYLWQALAALVGEALAKRWLASNLNRPQDPIANDSNNDPSVMTIDGPSNVSAATSNNPPPGNQDERDSR